MSLDEILNLIESVSEGFPSYFGMYYRVPQYKQDNSNDDLGLTLIYFMARLNMEKF